MNYWLSIKAARTFVWLIKSSLTRCLLYCYLLFKFQSIYDRKVNIVEWLTIHRPVQNPKTYVSYDTTQWVIQIKAIRYVTQVARSRWFIGHLFRRRHVSQMWRPIYLLAYLFHVGTGNIRFPVNERGQRSEACAEFPLYGHGTAEKFLEIHV